jgi:hypothetical protein
MSEMGQTTTTRQSPLHQLRPAADMPPHEAMCEQCLEAALENARPWSGGPRVPAGSYFLWKRFIHRRPTERA